MNTDLHANGVSTIHIHGAGTGEHMRVAHHGDGQIDHNAETSDTSVSALAPPMCPMKMMFKKLPALQSMVPASSSSNESVEPSSSAKRDYENDSELSRPPLKKLALLESLAAAAVAASDQLGETRPADPSASQSPAQLSRKTVACKPKPQASALLGPKTDGGTHQDVTALQCKVQELEKELFYTREDLHHEQVRWRYFRKQAQEQNIWGVLMGVADLQGSEVMPLKNASHSEALLELEVHVEQLQQSMTAEGSRAIALSKETERLAAENQELQRQLIMQKAQDAMVTDKVVEHPLYKKVLACYHQERLLGQKYGQLLESLKVDLASEGRRCRAVQETLEEQEKRRRKKLELALFERDNRLLERDAMIKDLNYRMKRLEVIAEQAAYEQQKVKEYPVLIASLKKEMEKMRIRLERQRREGREEDLASEVESISKAYEDLSEQNGRLLAQLDEKDRLNNNLLTERLKNQHSISLLKAEVEANAQAMEVNEKLRINQEAWMVKMQEILQTLQNEEKLLARQCQDLQTINGQQERELVALRLELEELKQQGVRHREAAQQFTAQAEQLMRQNSESADDSRRKGDELQRLQSKYDWLQKKATDSAPKPTSMEAQEVVELRQQVLALRAVLNCNVCGRRRKNTILTRCFHIFCSECVEDNLKDRKRKCPQCATKFAESDVKPVFLCEK